MNVDREALDLQTRRLLQELYPPRWPQLLAEGIVRVFNRYVDAVKGFAAYVQELADFGIRAAAPAPTHHTHEGRLRLERDRRRARNRLRNQLRRQHR